MAADVPQLATCQDDVGDRSLHDPATFEVNLERYAALVVMTVAYGHCVDDMNNLAVLGHDAE